MKSRTKYAILSAICLVGAALACNVPLGTGQPPSTVTPQAVASPAPAQTQPAPGITFSYQGVSFIIPPGLADGANGTMMPKIDDQSGAPWEVAPAYIKILLQNYAPKNGNQFDPQVLVYPADEYAQVTAYGDYPAQTIKAVADISANPAAPLPAKLPFLPSFNAGQLFDAQGSTLKFQNGGGLRFLTELGQDFGPVTNNAMFYTFQGLTGDGKYYVAVIFPAGAPFLDPGGETTPVVPDGGIPFDFNTSDHTEYYKAMSDRLDLTAPEVFTPSLATLDSLIESIKIVAP